MTATLERYTDFRARPRQTLTQVLPSPDGCHGLLLFLLEELTHSIDEALHIEGHCIEHARRDTVGATKFGLVRLLTSASRSDTGVQLCLIADFGECDQSDRQRDH
ncbi:MAG TPA: hypothetical protein VJU59_39380 [Paraburkholderia sp.]|uniref:hypothetical protein n=1 Tax=Paraburkholderia sp. TaxID=1926495 RepID=UPI002B493F25|nr:hypothetical protein [Paraburkholderia sp.]HKR45662.1 hypothetical protein [Paraburkholderia sp.]